MTTSKHKHCPLCLSKNIARKGNLYKQHNLIQCHNCSFVFMENIPSDSQLWQYYNEYSYSIDLKIPDSIRHSYNKLLNTFEKFRKNNLLVDYGCGRGWFLQEAVKRGWNVAGIEYSERAIKLNKMAGINVYSSFSELDSTWKNNIDVITSFEVIEHFYNPHIFIKDVLLFLRTKGLLYITTPNYNKLYLYLLKNNNHYICYPEHLNYYSCKTLNYLMELYGFKKDKIYTTGIPITNFKFYKSNNSLANSNVEDQFRDKISRHTLLTFLKNIINLFLTLTRMGISIKAYYVKK